MRNLVFIILNIYVSKFLLCRPKLQERSEEEKGSRKKEERGKREEFCLYLSFYRTIALFSEIRKRRPRMAGKGINAPRETGVSPVTALGMGIGSMVSRWSQLTHLLSLGDSWQSLKKKKRKKTF